MTILPLYNRSNSKIIIIFFIVIDIPEDNVVLLLLFQNTPLDVCLSKQDVENKCDLFIHENCEYNGTVALVATPGSIVDASHCQRFCKLFEVDLDCRYWVFESALVTTDKSTHCTLYKSFDVTTCDVILGPEAPLHSECSGCSCCDLCK